MRRRSNFYARKPGVSGCDGTACHETPILHNASKLGSTADIYVRVLTKFHVQFAGYSSNTLPHSIGSESCATLPQKVPSAARYSSLILSYTEQPHGTAGEGCHQLLD